MALSPPLATSPLPGDKQLDAPNGVVASSASATSFEPALFQNYLLSLLPPIVGASQDELSATLFDDDFDEKSSKFASEGGSVIYVLKIRDEGEGRRFHFGLT